MGVGVTVPLCEFAVCEQRLESSDPYLCLLSDFPYWLASICNHDVCNFSPSIGVWNLGSMLSIKKKKGVGEIIDFQSAYVTNQ